MILQHSKKKGCDTLTPGLSQLAFTAAALIFFIFSVTLWLKNTGARQSAAPFYDSHNAMWKGEHVQVLHLLCHGEDGGRRRKTEEDGSHALNSTLMSARFNPFRPNAAY